MTSRLAFFSRDMSSPNQEIPAFNVSPAPMASDSTTASSTPWPGPEIPGAPGLSTSCFHSRSECSRANSREYRIEVAHTLDGDQKRLIIVEPAGSSLVDLLEQVVFKLVEACGGDCATPGNVSSPKLDLRFQPFVRFHYAHPGFVSV